MDSERKHTDSSPPESTSVASTLQLWGTACPSRATNFSCVFNVRFATPAFPPLNRGRPQGPRGVGTTPLLTDLGGGSLSTLRNHSAIQISHHFLSPRGISHGQKWPVMNMLWPTKIQDNPPGGKAWWGGGVVDLPLGGIGQPPPTTAQKKIPCKQKHTGAKKKNRRPWKSVQNRLNRTDDHFLGAF